MTFVVAASALTEIFVIRTNSSLGKKKKPSKVVRTWALVETASKLNVKLRAEALLLRNSH